MMNPSFSCHFQRAPGPSNYGWNRPPLLNHHPPLLNHHPPLLNHQPPLLNCNQHQFQQHQFFNRLNNPNTHGIHQPVVPSAHPKQVWNSGSFNTNHYQNNHYSQQQQNQNQSSAWFSQHQGNVRQNRNGYSVPMQSGFYQGNNFSCQVAAQSLPYPPWHQTHFPKRKQFASRNNHTSINCVSNKVRQLKEDAKKCTGGLGVSVLQITETPAKGDASGELKKGKDGSGIGDAVKVLMKANANGNSEEMSKSLHVQSDVTDGSSKNSAKTLEESPKISSDSLQSKEMFKDFESENKVLKIPEEIKEPLDKVTSVKEPIEESEELHKSSSECLKNFYKESKGVHKISCEVSEESFDKSEILKKSDISKVLFINKSDALQQLEKACKNSVEHNETLKISKDVLEGLEDSHDNPKDTPKNSYQALKESNEVLKGSQTNKAFKGLIENQSESSKVLDKVSEALPGNEILKGLKNIEEIKCSSKNMREDKLKSLSKDSGDTFKKKRDNNRFKHSSEGKKKIYSVRDSLKNKSKRYLVEDPLKSKDMALMGIIKPKNKVFKFTQNSEKKISKPPGHKMVSKGSVTCTKMQQHVKMGNNDLKNLATHNNSIGDKILLKDLPRNSSMLKNKVKSDSNLLQEIYKHNNKALKLSKNTGEAFNDTASTAGIELSNVAAKNNSQRSKPENLKSSSFKRNEVTQDSSKSKDQFMKTSAVPARESLPFPSKVVCYTCKEVVKKHQMPSHLFFGLLKCRDCSREIKSCRNFKEIMRSVRTKESSPCFHRHLKWVNNPVSYIKSKLQREIYKRKLKSKPVTDDIMSVAFYAKSFRPLEHKSPWRSAIEGLQRCTGYLPGDMMESEERDFLESNHLSKVETNEDHCNLNSVSQGGNEKEDFQKKFPKSTSKSESQKNLLEDENVPYGENLNIVEPQPFDNERIPQIVEEEVVISQTMWEEDIICVGVVELVGENVSINVCENNVGLQAQCQSSFVDAVAMADEVETVAQAVNEEEVSPEKTEIPSKPLSKLISSGVSEELDAQQLQVKLVPRQVEEVKLECSNNDKMEIAPQKVEPELVKSIEDEMDDLMDIIQLDIKNARPEEIREKNIETKEACRTEKVEEESQIKRCKLSRCQHQPFFSFLQKLQKLDKNSKFWTPILTAARTFHEYTLKEDAMKSCHLFFDSEEADNEFMMDILLSHPYGLENLDEVTKFISVDHNILSKVKDTIEKSSIMLNRPSFVPQPLTRSTLRNFLSSCNKQEIPKSNRKHKRKREHQEKTPSSDRRPSTVFGKDIPQEGISQMHLVTPPADGLYYVVTYPVTPFPKECPMCYYRIFPAMFSLNLVTNLATARCFGCPLTIYVVQEPADASFPKIVFKNQSEPEVTRFTEGKTYKPRPARYKKTY